MCFCFDELEYWVEVDERSSTLYRRREQRADSSSLPPNVYQQAYRPIDPKRQYNTTLQTRRLQYTGGIPQKRVPKSELLELGKEAWLERRRKHAQLQESCKQLMERQERDEESRQAQCQPGENTRQHNTSSYQYTNGQPAVRRSAMQSARYLYGPTADRVEPRVNAVVDYDRSKDKYPGRSHWYGTAPKSGTDAHPYSYSPMTGYHDRAYEAYQAHDHVQARVNGTYW
ncbi:hypothetical protein AtubIFM56815_007054 [Aspergillus tubingensis]|uniref:Uncharacterized protein n=1 Tax=Aspergillus tubingensis TaxID=5068 RepID=A0A9W6AJA3_ASPTU|nr:hypothetical protein AtubIFM54640_005223 [Aspergillus tubingensis]GLA82863.1 hypothetical protein AtubIFM56815_007054 [Aspergillus tubingensis]